MLSLGGSLKRREALSARMGDVLSHLYLGSAVLKRFQDDDAPRADETLRDWALAESLYAIQQSLDEVLVHLPSRPLAWLLRALIFPLGRNHRPAGDRLTKANARLLMAPSEARQRLTRGIYQTWDASDAAGAVEDAMARIIEVAPLAERIRQAIKDGALVVGDRDDHFKAANRAGIIDHDEYQRLCEAVAARERVIAVDDFSASELARRD
jgi:acyl-CoA dehydrogenase